MLLFYAKIDENTKFPSIGVINWFWGLGRQCFRRRSTSQSSLWVHVATALRHAVFFYLTTSKVHTISVPNSILTVNNIPDPPEEADWLRKKTNSRLALLQTRCKTARESSRNLPREHYYEEYSATYAYSYITVTVFFVLMHPASRRVNLFSGEIIISRIPKNISQW